MNAILPAFWVLDYISFYFLFFFSVRHIIDFKARLCLHMLQMLQDFCLSTFPKSFSNIFFRNRTSKSISVIFSEKWNLENIQLFFSSSNLSTGKLGNYFLSDVNDASTFLQNTGSSLISAFLQRISCRKIFLPRSISDLLFKGSVTFLHPAEGWKCPSLTFGRSH